MALTGLEGDKDAVVPFGQPDVLNLVTADLGRMDVDPSDVDLVHVRLGRAVDLDFLEEALHCRPPAHLEDDWVVRVDPLEALAWPVPVRRVWQVLFSEPGFQDGAPCLPEHLLPGASEHGPQLVHSDVLRHRVRSEIDLH